MRIGLFEKSIEKCLAYCKSKKEFECAGERYVIESNIWGNNYILSKVVRNEDGLLEDRKAIESPNMGVVARYLWRAAGYEF